MGAFGTGYPIVPSGLVAGTITISADAAGTPQNLLSLIQAQIDPNCPSAREVNIQSDASGTVYFGAPSPLGGALSPTNYGFALPPTASRTYRSSFPGMNVSVGDLWVLMSAAGTFHVEVM